MPYHLPSLPFFTLFRVNNPWTEQGWLACKENGVGRGKTRCIVVIIGGKDCEEVRKDKEEGGCLSVCLLRVGWI